MESASYAGLPGGVGVSHLSVYDWPAADGLCGGTPHMHLTCSEGYVVIAGRGAVHTLTAAGARRTPLTPGTVAWFTPGTIHRLVNEDGALRIVVLMQNSGLPEAGDAVVTLPPFPLSDPELYDSVAVVPHDAPEAEQERLARVRRDLAVEGYLRLCEDPSGLPAFHRAAAALVQDRLDAWRERWTHGAAAAAAGTGVQLDRLAAGDPGHLSDAVVRAEEPAARGRFGMCGRLDVYRTEPRP
jgi:mannose-6-phosphate isomerase-like protein (cupin superfamily)